MAERSRLFWVGLAVLLIVAAVPRLLIYDFSLPYIDHPDEGTSYLEARQWRGQYPLGGGHEGYPPGHIALNYVVQQVTEGILGGTVPDTIRVMRLFSLAFNLGTLVCAALLGRLLAGDLAGWIAGALWALSPMVIFNGVIAIPDPLLYFLVSVAVLLVAYAFVLPAREPLLLWSFAVGLLAVVVKYQMFPVLLPAGLGALLMWRTQPKRALTYLAVMALSAGAVAWALVGLYGALDAFGVNRETVEMSQNGWRNILNPQIILTNLYRVGLPIHAPYALALLVVGGALALWRRSPDVPLPRWRALLPVGMMLVSVAWVVSAYALVTAEGSLIRHVMPLTGLACALVGAAAVQVGTAMPSRWGAGRVLLPVLLIGALFTWADVRQLAREIPLYRLPDSRVMLRQWADVNLTAGTVVVSQENHKTFNPFWGGIQGRQWFDWWQTDDFTQYPLAEWRDERGMSYMAIPANHWEQLQGSSQGQELLDELLFLRAFNVPPTMRGPSVYFFRTWGIASPLMVDFGGQVRLLGYDAPPLDAPLRAGDVLPLRLYWRALSTPTTNYSLFLHLTPLNTRDVFAQWDGAPTVAERLTVTWTDPQETLISPQIDFTLPPDLPAGEYRLLVGLYNFQTFERLPVPEGELTDAYALLRLRVR